MRGDLLGFAGVREGGAWRSSVGWEWEFFFGGWDGTVSCGI